MIVKQEEEGVTWRWIQLIKTYEELKRNFFEDLKKQKDEYNSIQSEVEFLNEQLAQKEIMSWTFS